MDSQSTHRSPARKCGGKCAVAGEKYSDERDYYMQHADFGRVVDPYRHGTHLRSNYLYLDLHVSTTPPDEALEGIDPWAGGLPPEELDPDPSE